MQETQRCKRRLACVASACYLRVSGAFLWRSASLLCACACASVPLRALWCVCVCVVFRCGGVCGVYVCVCGVCSVAVYVVRVSVCACTPLFLRLYSRVRCAVCVCARGPSRCVSSRGCGLISERKARFLSARCLLCVCVRARGLFVVCIVCWLHCKLRLGEIRPAPDFCCLP